MKKNVTVKLLIVVALAGAVGGALALKKKDAVDAGGKGVPVGQAGEGAYGGAFATEETPFRGIPRFLDLGQGHCLPCKMMMPILDELAEEYRDRMEVVYIDTRYDRAATKRHKIRLIPTQIFFDGEGKELARHEGFISKEDILAKWKELGVDLAGN